jgi:hypothetical protein
MPTAHGARGVTGDLDSGVAVPLRALDDAGVRWCLLRGADELALPIGEIDLLVAAADLAAARIALIDAGFAELSAWGRRPHSFFAVPRVAAGGSLKLDVVTELVFGRHQELPTSTADAVLERRERVGALVLPASADAFWALVLHELLDGGTLRGDRVEELRALAAGARGGDSPLVRTIAPALPAGWDAARVVDAAAGGRFAELVELTAPLRTRWPGGGGASARLRVRRSRLLRAIDHRRPRRGAPLIALVGGDPGARAAVAAAIARGWPEPSVTLDGERRLAIASQRARGRLVIAIAPGGGRTAAAATARVSVASGRDPVELATAAVDCAWRARVAQQTGRITSYSPSRSTG